MRGQALQEQCMLNIHTAWSQRTADLPSTPCRTDREKEAGGVPDIPTPGRLVELEYAAHQRPQDARPAQKPGRH